VSVEAAKGQVEVTGGEGLVSQIGLRERCSWFGRKARRGRIATTTPIRPPDHRMIAAFWTTAPSLATTRTASPGWRCRSPKSGPSGSKPASAPMRHAGARHHARCPERPHRPCRSRARNQL